MRNILNKKCFIRFQRKKSIDYFDSRFKSFLNPNILMIDYAPHLLLPAASESLPSQHASVHLTQCHISHLVRLTTCFTALHSLSRRSRSTHHIYATQKCATPEIGTIYSSHVSYNSTRKRLMLPRSKQPHKSAEHRLVIGQNNILSKTNRQICCL